MIHIAAKTAGSAKAVSVSDESAHEGESEVGSGVGVASDSEWRARKGWHS